MCALRRQEQAALYKCITGKYNIILIISRYHSVFKNFTVSSTQEIWVYLGADGDEKTRKSMKKVTVLDHCNDKSGAYPAWRQW